MKRISGFACSVVNLDEIIFNHQGKPLKNFVYVVLI